MLSNLFVRMKSATSDKKRDVIGSGLLDGDGLDRAGFTVRATRLTGNGVGDTFANICPPNILNGARTATMNVFGLMMILDRSP